jgi:hypothetical protein
MTLNQIVTFIQSIANNHKQINSSFVGLRDEWLSNGEVKYPAFFLEIKKSKPSRITRQTTHSFVCVIADLADVAANTQQNEIEVQSDLCQIAEDIIALLNKEGDANSDFTPSREIDVEYFTSMLEDVTIAAGFEFTIATKYAANPCQVPYTLPRIFDDTFDDTFDNINVPPPPENSRIFDGSFDEKFN